MKSKLLSDVKGNRQWAVIFDPNDEVMAGLKRFAESEQLSAAHFTGIGAFAELTVAWFNLEKQEYEQVPIDEQVEVLSLIGDVAESDGKPSVHAHICVAKRDGTAHGGHLIAGAVRPTLELVVSEAPAHLRKTLRKQSGLPLIDLDCSDADAEKQRSNHVHHGRPIRHETHGRMGRRAVVWVSRRRHQRLARRTS